MSGGISRAVGGGSAAGSACSAVTSGGLLGDRLGQGGYGALHGVADEWVQARGDVLRDGHGAGCDASVTPVLSAGRGAAGARQGRGGSGRGQGLRGGMLSHMRVV